MPGVKLQLIKQRDRYASVSAASNHEREVDEIMTSDIGDDPSFINQVHLVSPTFKTISIHKMLNDVLRVPETGNADRWSVFHSEYAWRLQHVNICTFLKYLWYEQLLNQSGMVRPTICKSRLDRYARGILSNLDTTSCRDPVDLANIVNHIAYRFRDDIEAIVTSSVDAFTDRYELREAFRLFLGMTHDGRSGPVSKARRDRLCHLEQDKARQFPVRQYSNQGTADYPRPNYRLLRRVHRSEMRRSRVLPSA
ncbi:MAG: hypothetical protein ABW185_00410 [Sedimenticola sp.]